MRTATERPASGLGLIDLHCHLLPGLDDGAKNRETTRAMAKAMAAQGVAGVVCTPHCTAGDPRLGERIAKIRMAMEEWKETLALEQLPLWLYPGMELLCTPDLPQTLARGDVLTLAGSRYLLIEFSFDCPHGQMEWAIRQVRQAGYVPVLAHPERYPAVWRDPERVADWFFQGTVIQLDQDSALGKFGRHCAHTSDWILRHGLAHVVASDAHDLGDRASQLAPLFQQLARRYGSGYAEVLLCRNPMRMLRDRELVRPAREE